MINQVGQIMLYVYNQDQARDFWTEKVGFSVISEGSADEMKWIEIAPTKNAERTHCQNAARIKSWYTVFNVLYGES